MDDASRLYGKWSDLALFGNIGEAVRGALALIVVTEWRSIRSLDVDELMAALKKPVIFHGRNPYDLNRTVHAGFTYHGNGLGTKGERVA